MESELYRNRLFSTRAATGAESEVKRVSKSVKTGMGVFVSLSWHIVSIFPVWLALLAMPTSAAADLIIHNVTVISPELSGVQKNKTVRIHNDRIVSISNAKAIDNITASAEDIVLDGRDRFLIPGLMDSHLHTSVIPGLGFEGSERVKLHQDMYRAYIKQFPRSLLYYGITHFLDPAPLATGLEKLKSAPAQPDVFHCGPVIVRGGYPLNEMGSNISMHRFPYIISSGDAFASDNSKHTAQSIVARIKASGSICIKLFFENGFGPRSDLPMPSQNAFKKLIDAARDAGLIVVGHANAFDMQQLAVDVGVDVLGHGVWNWGAHRLASELPEPIARHLDTVVDRKISYQPTLRVIGGIQALFDSNTLSDPLLQHVVAPELLNWYGKPDAQWFKTMLLEDEDELGGLPDHVIQRIMGEVARKGERALSYLVANGHPVLLASDHPAHPGHANHPGYSSYLELTHLARLGISLDKILAGATLNNAEAFDLADDYGTVEVGKMANLLLLTENPLEKIEAYDQIDTIILRGRAIPRESLSATSGK